MKKKTLAALLLLFAMLLSLNSCLLVSLPDDSSGGENIDSVYAYQLAKEYGYTGSYDDFMAEIKGDVGEKGEKGDKGDKGDAGADGTNGKDGTDGLGILSVRVDSTGHLIITYTDGSSYDAGAVISSGDISVTPDASDRHVNEALLSSVSVMSKLASGMYSAGAGVIYKLDKQSGDAYIITNHHVVFDEDADAMSENVSIFLYGQESYPDYAIKADIIGATADYDIAVLKVSGSEILKNSSARQITVANSDSVAAYDEVIAIGNPLGDGIAVNAGRVSMDNEPIVKSGASGTDITVYMLRFDAAVNEGNSGGGLFTDTGSFIGTVTLKKMSDRIDNMAYAVPSNLVVSLAEKIIKNCETEGREYAIKPIFGIQIKVYEAYSEFDEQTGAVTKKEYCAVEYTSAGSAAEGLLLSGDKLVAAYIGEREYILDRTHKVVELAIDVSPTDTVKFKLLRDGVEILVEVPLSEADFVEIK